MSWKHSYISKGDRLTLIKAVLRNLPTYYLSTFKAPSSICKKIEKLMRNFFWKGSSIEKRAHLVRWDLITKPKENGGLGIDKIKITNEALLAKWIWRFFEEPDSLWRNVIKAKYHKLSLTDPPTEASTPAQELLG